MTVVYPIASPSHLPSLQSLSHQGDPHEGEPPSPLATLFFISGEDSRASGEGGWGWAKVG